MPVYKCENGKYKIGKNGECKYSTKEDAEKAWEHWIEHGYEKKFSDD